MPREIQTGTMTAKQPVNGPFVAFGKSEIEQSIPARFEQKVLENRDRLAVKMNGDQVTYSELNRRSNCIGNRLLELSGHRQEPVALLMGQSISLIAAILGSLKAGKIYVPIDPTSSPAKIGALLKSAQIDFVITDRVNTKKALNVVGINRQVISADTIDQNAGGDNLDLDLSPENFAYVFYTSGSTGGAKGVVDSHRNVLQNIMRYTNNLKINRDDRLTLLQKCNFSGSVSSLFCALLNGASIYPFDLGRIPIDHLADALIKDRITVYHSVPSLFEQLLRTGRHFEHFRVIRLEGDRCALRHVSMYQRHFSDECILANGLGATETGLSHQYFIGPNTVVNGSVVPVGSPCVGVEATILDNAGHVVPTGQQGEIAILSAYLAAGYWRDSDLTNTAFKSVIGTNKRMFRTGDLGRINDDGMLEHLGRKDFQVKLRGQAVDVNALESALERLPGVSQAAVRTHTTWSGRERLVAYVVLGDSCESTEVSTVAGSTIEQDFNETWFRTELSELFPAYMIPARFVKLNNLPLDSNGKVSRKELQPPSEQRPSLSQHFVEPRSGTEKHVATIWCEILGLKQVGLYDDFFELGGDSMLAMALPMLIEESIGTRLSDASLLEARNVSEFAQLIDKGNSMRCLVAIQPRGSMRPFFCIHAHTGRVLQYRDLAELLGKSQPFYALQPRGYDGDRAQSFSIEEMAADYICEIREIQPCGPYAIGGYCFGGLVAYEIARQLQAIEQAENLIVLIDTECRPQKLFGGFSPRKYMLEISQLPFGEIVAYLFGRIGTAVRRPGRFLSTRLMVFPGIRQGAERKPKFPWKSESSNIEKSLAAAYKRYKPRSYDGNVTLIRVDSDKAYDPGAFAGWKALVKGSIDAINLPVVDAKNSYDHLFHEPYLSLLGDALRHVLAVDPRDVSPAAKSDVAN